MSYCLMSYTIHGIVLLYTIIQAESLRRVFMVIFVQKKPIALSLAHVHVANIINKIFTYMHATYFKPSTKTLYTIGMLHYFCELAISYPHAIRCQFLFVHLFLILAAVYMPTYFCNF